MSIRHGLLALLQDGPKYGYQLRVEFEHATGTTWPLNVGQVYTTLTRLDRDGLVRGAGEDGEGRVMYEITDQGSDELTSWFRTPVSREARPRDELAIKLALALTVNGVDVGAIVQTQRTATLRTLQELTRLKRDATEKDISWLLILDGMIFQAEAEVRWLDHCESRLIRHKTSDTKAPQPQPDDIEVPR
ncbi:PadR family transcriptional regulator [Tenggerimyces flavus]|uniref:PadR family transcriptional regulator n=1 Tax=Tenggerimyces flavus TaxID=1708749 RepID=A0ABV7Y410_9ACTN|nr:PadR family transcriptional regulator [Tenggerimyces flavus]MBM7790721.1 DNA-binding PadR family transcriptional regulator [Tenggerimyces flavus]